MRKSAVVALAIAAMTTFASGGVAFAGVVLGASFGYTHLSYPDLPDFTNNVVALPGSAEWGQPGLRVGYVSPGERWDLNADFGLVHRSGSIGSDQTTIEVLPQIQVNAVDRGGIGPLANVGVGFRHETALTVATNSISATRLVFGVGVGARKSVSDDHGFLRVEFRYDYVSEHEQELSPTATFTFPATHLYSIKLGFDLLVAR